MKKEIQEIEECSRFSLCVVCSTLLKGGIKFNASFAPSGSNFWVFLGYYVYIFCRGIVFSFTVDWDTTSSSSRQNSPLENLIFSRVTEIDFSRMQITPDLSTLVHSVNWPKYFPSNSCTSSNFTFLTIAIPRRWLQKHAYLLLNVKLQPVACKLRLLYFKAWIWSIIICAHLCIHCQWPLRLPRVNRLISCYHSCVLYVYLSSVIYLEIRKIGVVCWDSLLVSVCFFENGVFF